MTDKELRKLSRRDLLELLLAQSREQDALKQELAKAREELAKRQICLEQAGSIAEAALRLNGVFEAAQAAADQYLESTRRQQEGTGAGDGQREPSPESTGVGERA